MRPLSFALVVAALVLALGSPVMADVVLLKNGDRLSGDIVAMEKDSLSLKTAYAGKVSIAWGEVESVSSDKDVALYLKDGRRVEGAVESRDGKTVVAGKDAEGSPIDLDQVEAINKKPRDDDFQGSVKAGWNKAEGNTRKENVAASADLSYSLGKNRWKGHGDYYWGESKGVRTDYNWLGTLDYDRFLTDKIYANANGLIQQDQFQDLDLRTALGAGLGYQFFNSEELTLSLEAGPSYVWEDYISRSSRDYLSARWALDFGWWAVKGRLKFYHNQIGLVSTEDIDNWIWQSRTGMLFPIVDRFFGTLQYDYDWTNQPAPGKVEYDSRLMFSLGYSFTDFPWAGEE